MSSDAQTASIASSTSPPTSRPQKNARPMSFAPGMGGHNAGLESKMPSRTASASVSHGLSSSVASSKSSLSQNKDKEKDKDGSKKWWKLGKK